MTDLALGYRPPPWPKARCDMCRDDLLFELELDAWRPNQR